MKLRDILLIDEIKHCWKALSVWALVLVGAAPDIYQGVVAMGWLDDEGVPPAFVWSIRTLAVLGIVGRYIRQRKDVKPLPPPQ